jgi:hypothetical protein
MHQLTRTSPATKMRMRISSAISMRIFHERSINAMRLYKPLIEWIAQYDPARKPEDLALSPVLRALAHVTNRPPLYIVAAVMQARDRILAHAKANPATIPDQ